MFLPGLPVDDPFYPPTVWWQRVLGYIWAAPNSLLGLSLGGIGLSGGGNVECHRGCLEFSGGMVTWLLRRGVRNISAMTLGHTILGQHPDALTRARDHEQVHVRQYERWGPLFLPAYLGWSLVLWLRGEDPYLQNPFEVEAYRHADPRESQTS